MYDILEKVPPLRAEAVSSCTTAVVDVGGIIRRNDDKSISST